MYRINKLCVFMLFFIAGVSVFAQHDPISSFSMPSARSGGIGGTHITNTDGVGALLYNPAGLAGRKETSVFETSLSVYGPFDKLSGLYKTAMDLAGGESSDISGLGQIFDGQGRAVFGLNMGGPISIAVIRKGFGVGLFSNENAVVAVNNGEAKIMAQFNFQLNVGYGFKILEIGKNTLNIGIAGKGFYRMTYDFGVSTADFSFIDGFPLTGTYGVGLDLGVMYQYNKNFSIAVACTDLLSFARVSDISGISSFTKELAGDNSLSFDPYNTSVYRDLNVGMHYTFNNTGKVFTLAVMADYHDILDLFSDLPRNPILNVGLGAEIGLWKRLFIRAGVADALPAVGIGVDLWVFKLDFAVHGKELGLDPGVQPVYAMDLSMAFRW